MTPTLSVAAGQLSWTDDEPVAVADSDEGPVGACVSPPPGIWIETEAPAGPTDSVVSETPVSGSTTVPPTPSAASEKVVVLGFASTSFDWTMLVVAGAMRIETPLTTGSLAEKLSK